MKIHSMSEPILVYLLPIMAVLLGYHLEQNSQVRQFLIWRFMKGKARRMIRWLWELQRMVAPCGKCHFQRIQSMRRKSWIQSALKIILVEQIRKSLGMDLHPRWKLSIALTMALLGIFFQIKQMAMSFAGIFQHDSVNMHAFAFLQWIIPIKREPHVHSQSVNSRRAQYLKLLPLHICLMDYAMMAKVVCGQQVSVIISCIN